MSLQDLIETITEDLDFYSQDNPDPEASKLINRLYEIVMEFTQHG